MNKADAKKLLSAYMSEMGSKGGAVTGACKKRGSKEFYKKLSEKAVAARKRKARELAKA